jgi:hypothetical protein
MRWAVLVILAVIALHHAAMGQMPHAVAAAAPMAHATIAHPEPCNTTDVGASSGLCAESCSILQAASVSLASVAPSAPTTVVGHVIADHRYAPAHSGSSAISGPASDAGSLRSSAPLALRI